MLEFFVMMLCLVGLAFSAGHLWYHAKVAKGWVDALRNLPLRPIAEAMEGTVVLEGRAEPLGEALTSPAHQHECVAYSVEVFSWMKRFNRSNFEQVYRAVEVVPFRLVDSTGEAVIEATNAAELDLRKEPYLKKEFFDDLEPHLAEWVRARNVPVAGSGPHDYIEFRERRLDAGETCTVIGEVVRLAAGPGGATYRQGTRVPVIRSGAGTLAIADLPHEKLQVRVIERLWLAWIGAVVFGVGALAALHALLT